MKINEIIIEAVNPQTGTPQGKPSLIQKAGNFVKRAVGGVKGIAQGYQASQQQRQGAQTTQQQANTWIAKWNQTVGANPALKNNPQALQNYAKKLARDMYGNALFTPEMPTDMSPVGVNKYITGIIGRTLSGGLAQTPAKAPASTATVNTSNVDAPATDILDDMRIVSNDPLVIQYGPKQNKRFHLNNRGQWAFFPGEKAVDQTTAKLLSNKAEAAGL